jgi:2-desacetyl-2-hydroxyethyl bacteriochlorophyllide A dehydrogenase
MKAAVFYGPRDIRVEEVERPKIEASEILIKVMACGICGSDLHTYRLGLFPELGLPIDSGRILGHEFGGDVVEAGEQVEGVKVGDRVTAITMGAMAEYVKVTPFINLNVFHIPSEVSYEEAATNEPLATSLHAVVLASPTEGETIMVMGAGIVGLGVLQVLKARYSNRVIVADISQKRLAMAEQLGADVIIDASAGDPYEKLLEIVGTAPQMFYPEPSCAVDIAIDCVGRIADIPGVPVVQQLLAIVREGGKVVLVGAYEETVELDLNVLMIKGLRVSGSFGYGPQEFGEALELIRAGKVDRKPLISHEFTLDRAKEAFETQIRVGEAIKVLFKP